tara:strand:- start:1532 stop:1801 length:270 start_codon:yes stop_codon:yes gene_type:complete
MKIILQADMLAMVLTHRKIEKKYEDLDVSPYEPVHEEYIGQRLTEEAGKDYDKHYEYFFDIIMSVGKVVEDEFLIKKTTDEQRNRNNDI